MPRSSSIGSASRVNICEGAPAGSKGPRVCAVDLQTIRAREEPGGPPGREGRRRKTAQACFGTGADSGAGLSVSRGQRNPQPFIFSPPEDPLT